MTIDTAKERERVYSDLKLSPFPVKIRDYLTALDALDALAAEIERLRAQLQASRVSASEEFPWSIECRLCAGSGLIVHKICSRCGGTGRIAS